MTVVHVAGAAALRAAIQLNLRALQVRGHGEKVGTTIKQIQNVI